MDNFDPEEKLKELTKIVDLKDLQGMIENNFIPFEYEDKSYRIRKPKFREKKELQNLRAKKYMELIKVKDDEGNCVYKSELDLIKFYKEQGIDIAEIDKEIDKLQKYIKDSYFKLGEAVKDNLTEEQLKPYEKDIETTKNQMARVLVKKTHYMEYSIENQLIVESFYFLGYLLTEKLVVEDKEETWAKLWNSYDEFLEADEILANRAGFYASCITSENLDI